MCVVLQPFVLGGDAVCALALNASPELQEAILDTFCDDASSSESNGTVPDSLGLEEAHLSVLVSDLDPAFSQQQHEFLVSARSSTSPCGQRS